MVASATTTLSPQPHPRQSQSQGKSELHDSSVSLDKKKQHDNKLPPAPFTIKEIRDRIPAHCFQRSALGASQFLAVDLLSMGILFYAATLISSTPVWVQFVLWPTYWFVQGLVGTGVWVVGHECGHQSFSESKALNDAVGLVLHSLLLVPYHSWRITHGQHHKHTSHMEHDQVFVPSTRSYFLRNGLEAARDSPLGGVLGVLVMWTVGWPGYLLLNASGQDYKRRTNHFEPAAPMFKSENKFDVVLSDVGLAVTMGLLAWAAATYGVLNVVMFYFVPYLWVNFWLVTITFLQHTDPRVPHYRGAEWSFIRGALSTIDRDFGVLNTVFHNITDSHVAHHLFSTMPHWKALEATPYLAEFLGPKYYLYDTTPFLTAVLDSWRACQYVDDEGEVVYYKSLLVPAQ